MSSHLTPLEVCEALIAPIEEISGLCGHHPKTAYGWRRASSWRDAGHFPSSREQRAMIAAAAKRIPEMTFDPLWVIEGAPRDDIRALCAALGRPWPRHLTLVPKVAAE